MKLDINTTSDVGFFITLQTTSLAKPFRIMKMLFWITRHVTYCLVVEEVIVVFRTSVLNNFPICDLNGSLLLKYRSFFALLVVSLFGTIWFTNNILHLFNFSILLSFSDLCDRATPSRKRHFNGPPSIHLREILLPTLHAGLFRLLTTQ